MNAMLGNPSRTGVFSVAHVTWDHPQPVPHLCEQLGDGPFAALLAFVTPDGPFSKIITGLKAAYPDAQIVACTTAGEISPRGYTDGEIVVTGLPAENFAVQTMLIEDLGELNQHGLIGNLLRKRSQLTRENPDMAHEFAFLAVDGLSLREDEVMSVLAPGLGPMPLFGGSAGDGDRFGTTYVALDETIYTNAAVLCLVRTRCPVKVFSLDHFHPTDSRMVVTKADTSRRLVQEINAEPAAREYARILGLDPEMLDSFTFAAHPVVVRIGNTHHVRSIQQITENGEMVFFSAIGEGLVLSLAQPVHLAEHLERELAAIARSGPLEGIIACDCLFRRIEAEQSQQSHQVSQILRKNRVTGFATYGEQIGAKHVNQTITGVAIFSPES